ncbi:zinc metalloproteinase nas-13-like [Watersipora subatra]|uniref:zinc metalloproteinase nas-13-like n=1 Tax=Watersipora subatra TaxID=2589382 RepID=UPI00355B05B4
MYKIGVLTVALLSTAWCVSAMMIDGKQMSIDDAIIKAGSNGSMSKMFEIMQDEDSVMVELDMLYKIHTYNKMVQDMVPIDADESSRKKRKAIRAESYRWTNQRIPYEISYEFSDSDRSKITSAINDYHRYTCLRFVPATSSDYNKVRFQNGGGCSSYVGMIGNTQPISLAPGCRHKGIVIHEMGHTIGFQHEQTRPDRDNYVYIQKQNIQSGVEYNFMKYSKDQVNNYDVPYDYTSVMHYSGTAFSKNGQPTILARQTEFQDSMGNRDGLSFKDIQLANTMYDCANVNRCAARSCPQGFQGPDCECWCESGDKLNPVKKCDGTGPIKATTTPMPTRPMTCNDKNRNCQSWANAGYCTGNHRDYMNKNCPYSCNTCQVATTVRPPPPVVSCTDKNSYCRHWAERGECSRNPSYMLNNCKKSCKACDGGQSACQDLNSYCPSYVDYCDHPLYKEYLSTNCMKTCSTCTTHDENIAAPVTVETISQCKNRWSDRHCAGKQSKCRWNSRVSHMIKMATLLESCTLEERRAVMRYYNADRVIGVVIPSRTSKVYRS